MLAGDSELLVGLCPNCGWEILYASWERDECGVLIERGWCEVCEDDYKYPVSEEREAVERGSHG